MSITTFESASNDLARAVRILRRMVLPAWDQGEHTKAGEYLAAIGQCLCKANTDAIVAEYGKLGTIEPRRNWHVTLFETRAFDSAHAAAMHLLGTAIQVIAPAITPLQNPDPELRAQRLKECGVHLAQHRAVFQLPEELWANLELYLGRERLVLAGPVVDDSKWPNQADVAKSLGISKTQVKRLIVDGTLTTNQKTGVHCRIDPASYGLYLLKDT